MTYDPHFMGRRRLTAAELPGAVARMPRAGPTWRRAAASPTCQKKGAKPRKWEARARSLAQRDTAGVMVSAFSCKGGQSEEKLLSRPGAVA
jgi:hypothetical protein